MTDFELINIAVSAMKNAYAPYSDFKVGAALLLSDGRCFSGCNIENAAYPAGICAERAAVSGAVSAGATDFVKIAIVGGKYGSITDFCTPCGICRQVLAEFCGEDFEIITYDGKKTEKYTLGELLPLSFGRDNLCE
ncbi:MAG: cytidine deaminase [Clostridia bacterium]|nr:cytidine deaminase [Clostridia bacterium]